VKSRILLHCSQFELVERIGPVAQTGRSTAAVLLNISALQHLSPNQYDPGSTRRSRSSAPIPPNAPPAGRVAPMTLVDTPPNRILARNSRIHDRPARHRKALCHNGFEHPRRRALRRAWSGRRAIMSPITDHSGHIQC
jgi:hypothetical protein